MIRTVAIAALVLVGCGSGDAAPCDRDVDDLAAEVRASDDDSDDDADLRAVLVTMMDECPARFDAVMDASRPC